MTKGANVLIVDDQEPNRDLLSRDFKEVNADFEALQEVSQHASEFSAAELDELRCLLGQYGMEMTKRLQSDSAKTKYVEERQGFWSGIQLRDGRCGGRTPRTTADAGCSYWSA